jgi:iron complex outermembrane receptor protein
VKVRAILLLLATLPVHAQESAEPAESAAPPAQTEEQLLPTVPVEPLSDKADPVAVEPGATATKLDDVVVTATKRKQASRDVPSSMAVLQGEKLEQLGYRELKEIFTLVPGVNMTDEIAGIQRKVSIRGVGPDTNTNQTVGSVMGDIPISDPYGATTIIDPNPWDMRTVEILKGPQGTLFGATSLAGLIRYVPNAPELGRFSGKAFYDYTTVDMGSAASAYGAVLNVPVGETIAFRASGILQHRPGVIDVENPARTEEDVNTGRSYNWRAMALWQPTDRFTLNAWYTQDQRHSDEISIVTHRDGSYTRDDAPTASPADNGYRLATLDLRYAFDWATLVSLSGYQQKFSHSIVDTSYLVQPIAQSGTSFLVSDRSAETRGFLQELRLVSPDGGGAFSWIAGAYHSTFEQDIYGTIFVPNTEVLALLVQLLPLPVLQGLINEHGLTATQVGYRPLEAVESALYGEANYDFTRNLRLTLGSRLYRTSVEGTLRSSGASSANDGAQPGTTEKGWSPKIAVTYRPWRDALAYASVSRGFQFGGFNLPTIPAPDVPLRFESSTLWNYEAGLRTDWFDRTLRVDLTGFFLDWKNPQVSQVDRAGVSGYVDNVGRTHSIGVEGTIRWLTPLNGLSIEESASYIEARTQEPFQDASGAEIPPGTIMPSSPRVQSVTTLAYTRAFGTWIAQASLINSFKSKAYSEITHETEVGNYSLLSFNFNVKRIGASFSPALTLSVNNITNVQEVVAGIGPAGGGESTTSPIVADTTYVYTVPRSIVLRLSAEF